MQLNSYAGPAAAFLALAVLPTASQAVAVVPNFSIGGIPIPGFPHFDNKKDITLTLAKSGSGAGATYQLTANYTAPGIFRFQYDPAHPFNVVNGTYQLVASFNSSAALTGGSVTVNGIISGYNIPDTTAPPTTSSLLYKADLLGYGTDTTANATPMALGFKTGNTDPTSWAYQFQKTGFESVYLYDFNVAALMSSFKNPKFKTITFSKASALTTVPLPAAVWLFGSALAVLSGAGATARRRVVACG
jgi:hypothetical protein